MAKSVFITSNGGGINVPDNTTRYIPIAGSLTVRTNEVEAEVPIRDGGTFAKMRFYVSANTNTQNGSTVTVRDSQADTSITATINASQTGWFEDATNTATAAATDEFCYAVVCVNDGSGSRNITFRSLSIEFDATSDTVQKFAAVGSNAITASALTRMQQVNQVFSSSTTEARCQSKSSCAMTIQDLYAYISANTCTGDAYARIRVNGANGNSLATIGAGLTGAFEDTANTDSIAVDDLYTISMTNAGGASGSYTFTQISSTAVSTGGKWMYSNGIAAGQSLSINTTYWAQPSGHLAAAVTEADQEAGVKTAFTLSYLRAYVGANTVTTSDTVLSTRKNRAAGGQSVNIGAGLTGWFEDTTNSDSLVSDDEFCYQVVTPNTSGALTFYVIESMGSIATSTTAIKDLIGGFGIIPFPR